MKCVVRLLLVLVVLCLPVAARAGGRSSITFHNRSGADALVRLVGPTSGFVDVPDASSRTVDISAGIYRLYVRYGQPGHYRYTRGDPFTVVESGDSYERVEITLHVVAGGNYGSQPSNEAEFNNGR